MAKNDFDLLVQQRQGLEEQAETNMDKAGYNNAPVGLLAFEPKPEGHDYAIILKTYTDVAALPSFAAGTQDVWLRAERGIRVNVSSHTKAGRLLEHLRWIDLSEANGLPEEGFLSSLEGYLFRMFGDDFSLEYDGDKIFAAIRAPVELKGPMNKPEEQRKFLKHVLGWKDAMTDALVPTLRTARGGARETDRPYLTALMAVYGAQNVQVEPWRSAAIRESHEEAGVLLDSIHAGKQTGEYDVAIHSKRSLDAKGPLRHEKLIMLCMEEGLRLGKASEEVEDDVTDEASEEPAVMNLLQWRERVEEAIRIAGVSNETLAAANRFNAMLLLGQHVKDPLAATLLPIKAGTLGNVDEPTHDALAKAAKHEKLLVRPEVTAILP